MLAAEIQNFKGVLVWAEAELRGSSLRPKQVAFELTACARRLADKLGHSLTVAALGDDRLADLESLCHYGADSVLRCAHPLLGSFSAEGYCHVMAALIAQQKPSVALFGATPNGRALAPRVAARLRLGLTADCTNLEIDPDGQLVQIRPAFGGNIMASIISPAARPQAATVRPHVFKSDTHDPRRPVHIENITVKLAQTPSNWPIENNASDGAPVETFPWIVGYIPQPIVRGRKRCLFPLHGASV